MARGVDGRRDPTAGRGDVFVRFALETPVEFRFAVAREGKMRVRVDETGNGGRATGIEIRVDARKEIGIDVRLASDECETAVADDDGGVVVDGQLAHGAAAQRSAAERR